MNNEEVENVMKKPLSIKDKIINSLFNKENEIFSREEIINFVLTKYPSTNKTSIIPTDYCFNRKNKGSSKYELFEYIGLATFKYIGIDNEYEKVIYPDEIKNQTLVEGAKKQIIVNAYERDPKARQECIQRHGTKCSICKFDFGKVYGGIGKDFIHVHHKKPFSEIDKEHKINPIKDLIPVCPNCHAMIHKKVPAYSMQEIIDFIEKKNLYRDRTPHH